MAYNYVRYATQVIFYFTVLLLPRIKPMQCTMLCIFTTVFVQRGEIEIQELPYVPGDQDKNKKEAVPLSDGLSYKRGSFTSSGDHHHPQDPVGPMNTLNLLIGNCKACAA